MRADRRSLLVSCLGAACAAALPAEAQPAPAHAPRRAIIRIGVLTDMTGPYSGIAGQGSLACTRLAATDFAANAGPAFTIEVLAADHGNNAARGAAIAASWYDHDAVDLIIDVPDSDVALAVAAVARQKNRAYVNCGAGTTRLTGPDCSPNTIHWAYDTYMLARSTGAAVTRQGGARWFFLTADYDFGRRLEADMSHFIVGAGGRIEGFARYKFPGTSDFTPMLLSAQGSGASVLGLANAGRDAIETIRQARIMGIPGTMRIAALLLQLPDVHALGLEAAGGSLLTESFYWDLNPRTRAFTARLMAQQKPGNYPDMIQAGCYGATLHFLKSVAAMGVANARSDPASLVARMKATPTDDDAFGAGTIRQDGRALFPAYLFQVKTPAESNAPWDYYRLLSTTPPDQAFRPVTEGGCPMVKA